MREQLNEQIKLERSATSELQLKLNEMCMLVNDQHGDFVSISNAVTEERQKASREVDGFLSTFSGRVQGQLSDMLRKEVNLLEECKIQENRLNEFTCSQSSLGSILDQREGEVSNLSSILEHALKDLENGESRSLTLSSAYKKIQIQNKSECSRVQCLETKVRDLLLSNEVEKFEYDSRMTESNLSKRVTIW